MKPRIILVVKDEKRREAYLTTLEPFSECTVAAALKDIPDLLRQGACQGILIDIQVNIRAKHMEKVKISDSLEAMPSAVLNLICRSGAIRLLMNSSTHGSARTVEEFVALCADFQPKIIYPHDMGALHLNAILSSSPDFDEALEHTFTMSITGGGCFLFTANGKMYHPEDMVWIDFVGLEDRNSIRGRVCWKCDWGVSNAVPGIYVAFESISETQFEEIKSLLADKQKPFMI